MCKEKAIIVNQLVIIVVFEKSVFKRGWLRFFLAYELTKPAHGDYHRGGRRQLFRLL